MEFLGALEDGTKVVLIEKFDGTDFNFWKTQIEDVLWNKDLYLPLKEKPADIEQAKYEILDRKALGLVRQTLAKDVAKNVLEAKTTMEMLEMLASMYEAPSAANKAHLMRKLLNIRMVEGMSATKHISEFKSTATQLSSVDVTLDDEVLALILLSSLPDSWDTTAIAVNVSTGKVKLKFADVVDVILGEEVRRKSKGATPGLALNVSEKSKDGKKEITCYNCGKKGHFRRRCPERSGGAKGLNVAEEIADALILGGSSQTDSWVLDSGATFHSCTSAEGMEQYIPGDFGVVRLANNNPVKVVGKGVVRIKSTDGTVLRLRDVRHIPDLKRNLISIRQLDKEGCVVTFGCGTWKVNRGASLVARGGVENMLYTTCNMVRWGKRGRIPMKDGGGRDRHGGRNFTKRYAGRKLRNEVGRREANLANMGAGSRTVMRWVAKNTQKFQACDCVGHVDSRCSGSIVSKQVSGDVQGGSLGMKTQGIVKPTVMLKHCSASTHLDN